MEEARDSRGKSKFWIPVFKGILEHRAKIKDAIWLFLWYIDKTTREDEGADGGKVGHVLGGKPIRDSDVAPDLRCTKRSICTWRRRLQRNGYIDATRTPHGYSVRVLKSKKRFDKNPESHSTASGKGSGFGRVLPRDSPVASHSEKQVTSPSGKQPDNLIKTTQDKTKRTDKTKTNQPSETDGLVGRLALLFLTKTGKHLSYNRVQVASVAVLAHQNSREDVIATFEKWLMRTPGMDGIKWPLAVFIREYPSFSPECKRRIKNNILGKAQEDGQTVTKNPGAGVERECLQEVDKTPSFALLTSPEGQDTAGSPEQFLPPLTKEEEQRNAERIWAQLESDPRGAEVIRRLNLHCQPNTGRHPKGG
jgi:hypothetical protein